MLTFLASPICPLKVHTPVYQINTHHIPCRVASLNLASFPCCAMFCIDMSFMTLSPCVELASLVPKFQVTKVRNSMIQFVAYLSKVQLETSINLNCQVLSLKELRSREKFMSSLAYPYQCKLFPLGANASTILQY